MEERGRDRRRYLVGQITLNQSAVTGNIVTVAIGGILAGDETPVLNRSRVFGNVSPDSVQIGPE